MPFYLYYTSNIFYLLILFCCFYGVPFTATVRVGGSAEFSLLSDSSANKAKVSVWGGISGSIGPGLPIINFNFKITGRLIDAGANIYSVSVKDGFVIPHMALYASTLSGTISVGFQVLFTSLDYVFARWSGLTFTLDLL